jgi:hypothetical protein
MIKGVFIIILRWYQRKKRILIRFRIQHTYVLGLEQQSIFGKDKKKGSTLNQKRKN